MSRKFLFDGDKTVACLSTDVPTNPVAALYPLPFSRARSDSVRRLCLSPHSSPSFPWRVSLAKQPEGLALHTGPKIGGLLNATLGTMTELIIMFALLRSG